VRGHAVEGTGEIVGREQGFDLRSDLTIAGGFEDCRTFLGLPLERSGEELEHALPAFAFHTASV